MLVADNLSVSLVAGIIKHTVCAGCAESSDNVIIDSEGVGVKLSYVFTGNSNCTVLCVIEIFAEGRNICVLIKTEAAESSVFMPELNDLLVLAKT